MTGGRSALRAHVRGAYDLQKLRCATGLRIVANFKAKLGVEPGEKEAARDKGDDKLLNRLRGEFKLISEAVVEMKIGRRPKSRRGLPVGLSLADFSRYSDYGQGGLISNFAELSLVHSYVELLRQERLILGPSGVINRMLPDFPIWTQFLKGVKGCGPAMAGVIIAEIDIHRAQYPSSLWKYCGLDVGPDGRGRNRSAAHLRDVEYRDSSGNAASRKGLTYNPFVKTKMVGVLADCLVKAGDRYKRVYDDRKRRLAAHRVYGEQNDGKEIEGRGWVSARRRDVMAKREMIKRFLVDLYNAWRPLEGLSVEPSFHEAKLGHTHGGGGR